MLLENKYYKILRTTTDGPAATYHIALLPGCDVYRGHFPGNPVSPGVCNIQTIRECASLLTGKKLFISTIKQCRLTAVASPAICPEITIQISATPTDNGFNITAKITGTEKIYMQYKGEMTL
ncbi:MAG: beta-hydroxyacyl-ACP dehydratase [Tannerellaceae bacterium]|nr:beta-hydroxyacyl-ACP dehydratase [Tannerellaceae bacterium]MCD7914828.1 beta-hydroxyacyl-ACP dehydratase [Tannerellaceae bacterium]